MISKEMQGLLNKQINMELYSAYLYLDMANYYAEEGLDGFANWFTIQAQEERDHAMLFRTYCLNNDVSVKFEAIAKPDLSYAEFKTPLAESLKHEQLVTASIHKIYDHAKEESDYRTMQVLDWFVKEQGEEEMNATTNIRNYELFGSDAKGLYMLDQEMGTRIYAPPSLVL